MDIEHDDAIQPEDSGPDRAQRRGFARAFRRREATLITDARRSPLEDWEHRKRVYNILQGSRIPLLLASAFTYMWLHNVIISIILFILSIPMPWIAVVIANGHGEVKDKRSKQVYKPQLARNLQYQQAPGLHSTKTRELPAQSPNTVIDHEI